MFVRQKAHKGTSCFISARYHQALCFIAVDKSSSKVGVPVEEDIYTSIDELKGPQYASTYQ